MAKYLGIPLTVSNGNKIPLTAQPEKLVNGDFSDPTDGWTFGNNTSIVGGKLVCTSSTAYSATYQSVTISQKAYVVTFTIDSISGGSVTASFQNSKNLTPRSVAGTYTEKVVAPLPSTRFDFYTDDAGVSFEISNVSLKEIAATETPTYGSPELATNGNFEDASDWSGTNWTISGNGKAVHATTNNDKLIQSMGLESGKKYAIQWTVADYSSGSLGVSAASGTKSGDDAVSANGTYNTVLVSNGTAFQIFASGVASLSSVSVKEVPYVMGTRELVKNGSFATDTIWEKFNGATISDGRANIIGDGTSFTNINQDGVFTQGKVYELVIDVTIESGLGLKFQQFGYNESIGFATQTGVYTFRFEAISNSSLNIGRRTGGTPFESYINSVSVKELEYNYLQVSDGGFKKSVKEGDVIFNTSTSTEGVVKQVLDNNVLLMSNDNFSTAGEFFNVFAANGDTRGNQVVRTDNYIMSEYDENASNPQETSFWFAGGVNADKVALTQLNPATNTFFVAGVIEEYLERLNAQSATASRLDIPLDAFRDHKYNEVLTTTAITLS